MPAASASTLVVVPEKPLRANSGTAAATIAFRLSSLSNRIVAIGAESKRSLTVGQAAPVLQLSVEPKITFAPAGSELVAYD